MNRLLSEAPMEEIIFLIVSDGIFRQKIAANALHENGGLQNDASTALYYDTMAENFDALHDAYTQAMLLPQPEMKQAAQALNVYFQNTEKILEDGIFTCALTETEIMQMTAEAGQALNLTLEFSRKCLNAQTLTSKSV